MRDEKPAKCRVEGCEATPKARGYCGTHYARLTRNGTLKARPMRKRGTGGYTPAGYLVYQRVVNGRRVRLLAHREVMAGILGRPLLMSEHVHHRNGRKDDNRPENLELWTTRHPKGQRVEDVVEFAVEMLRLYAPHRVALAVA